MSPGWASRIPATPRTMVEPSPTTTPPSSAASSASVSVFMRALPGVVQPLERREDRRLVAHLLAELVHRFLLLARLVAPALHEAIEALLRLLRRRVLAEDPRRVDVAEAERSGRAAPRDAQREHGQQP